MRSSTGRNNRDGEVRILFSFCFDGLECGKGEDSLLVSIVKDGGLLPHSFHVLYDFLIMPINIRHCV